MRFISMVKSNEAKIGPCRPRRSWMPWTQLVQEAGKYGCVMVEGVGLHPTSAGMRVRLSGGKVTVTDGPFTEAKEVVGGYAIFDAPSKAAHAEMDRALHGAAQEASARLGGRMRGAPDRADPAKSLRASPRARRPPPSNPACGIDGTGHSR